MIDSGENYKLIHKEKVRKSSILGILIVYYVLMDSCFPFWDNGKSQGFFYWSKFFLAIGVILYAGLKYKNCNKELKKICKKICYMFTLPWVVMLIYSVFLWIFQKSNTPYITRGISNFLSIVIPIILGGALIIIFEERVINIIVTAIILMSLSNYIVGVFVNGPSFILQLFNVACEETTYRIYKELHEIAYISGLLILFYCQKKKNIHSKVYLIILSVIFFISWKRIGILALLLSLLYFVLISKINKKEAYLCTIICGISGVLVSLIYVWMSASSGLSSFLNNHGINMMGRDVLYSYFRKHCSFSIGFMGKGIGFVSRQFNYLTWDDVGEMVLLKQGLHNDLFSVFIEIGMVCYILWLVYQLVIIPIKIKHGYRLKSMIQCFSYIIFSFVTFTTDNTLRYFVYQMVFVMLFIIEGYENKIRKDVRGRCII